MLQNIPIFQFKYDPDILTNEPNNVLIYGDLNVQHLSWNIANQSTLSNSIHYYPSNLDTYLSILQSDHVPIISQSELAPDWKMG